MFKPARYMSRSDKIKIISLIPILSTANLSLFASLIKRGKKAPNGKYTKVDIDIAIANLDVKEAFEFWVTSIRTIAGMNMAPRYTDNLSKNSSRSKILKVTKQLDS